MGITPTAMKGRFDEGGSIPLRNTSHFVSGPQILFRMFMILDVFRVVSFVQAVAMTQNSSVIGENAILFVAE